MRIATKLILLLLVLLPPAWVYGDTAALPHSYATPSANGKFVFVMLAPVEADREGITLGAEERAEARRVRAKYPASGMYLNDGATTPLWTVDWYHHSVLVASDGVHLVRFDPWVSDRSDEAFTFFAGGEAIRTYKVSDLVDIEAVLPQTVSHFEWEGDIHLDDEKRVLAVTTLSKEKYVFDYATGELVSARRPLRGIVVAVGVVLAFMAVWMLRRRGASARPAV